MCRPWVGDLSLLIPKCCSFHLPFDAQHLRPLNADIATWFSWNCPPLGASDRKVGVAAVLHVHWFLSIPGSSWTASPGGSGWESTLQPHCIYFFHKHTSTYGCLSCKLPKLNDSWWQKNIKIMAYENLKNLSVLYLIAGRNLWKEVVRLGALLPVFRWFCDSTCKGEATWTMVCPTGSQSVTLSLEEVSGWAVEQIWMLELEMEKRFRKLYLKNTNKTKSAVGEREAPDFSKQNPVVMAHGRDWHFFFRQVERVGHQLLGRFSTGEG